MLNEHIRRETLEDPFVFESLLGGQAFSRVPLQALRYEVHKRVIRDISQLYHDVLESLFLLTLCKNLEGRWNCIIFKLREEMLPLRNLEDISRYHTNHIDYELKLFSLVGTWEERESCEQLNHYTAHAPHVYGLSVWEYSQHNLWGTVEPTLYVCVHYLFIKSATSEICNDNATLVLLFQQDILRFQITVDDPQRFHIFESAHKLDGKTADEPLLETCIVIHLYELIQIQTVQIECHAQMVPEYEVILYLDDAFFILRVIFLCEQQ